MHDPDVVLFDLDLPIPRLRRYWVSGKTWEFSARRRTNPENLGERVFPWWRPMGYKVRAFGREMRWTPLATVWHHEPGGRDYSDVCGRNPTGSILSVANVRRAWEHRDHVTVSWTFPGTGVVSWLRTRCSVCGDRFEYREPKYGGWVGDEVWHGRCANVRDLAREGAL